MAERNTTPPPASMGAVGRGQRGKPPVKPKDMKGTLQRLWSFTNGHRKGLGWIMALSALSSASAILSPLVIGDAVTAIDSAKPARLRTPVLPPAWSRHGCRIRSCPSRASGPSADLRRASPSTCRASSRSRDSLRLPAPVARSRHGRYLPSDRPAAG